MGAFHSFTIEATGESDIVMRRGFNAPRDMVFEAFTTPDLVRRWLLGPDGWTMPICEIDLRPGGRYRYGWSQPGHESFGVTGTYKEIVRPQRIVHTERFEPGWYDGEALITTVFAEAGAGKTDVTMTMHLGSTGTRKKVLATGMEKGVKRSYERLEEVATGGYSIVPVEHRHTAVIKGFFGFADLPKTQREARAKIAAALPGLAAGKEGRSMTLSRVPQGGSIYLEPGVIVERSFAPTGEVVPGELPGGEAVRYLLKGSFEQLPQAWPALMAWSREHGYTLQGTFWEIYGPTASDPAAQETELFALLV